MALQPSDRSANAGTDAGAGADVDPLPTLLVADLDAGFVALVRSLESSLYSVALRLCAAPPDAEDLCAETFTRAYRALRSYPPDRVLDLRPRAWLMTILLNGWRNSVRDRSRRPRTVPLVAADDLVDTTSGAAEKAEARETAAELAEMVRRLPEAQRTAVVLRHLGDLSIAEIAEVLGCAEGTAKSHVSRALGQLRSMHERRKP